jgi:hypothetical protein
MRNDTLNDTIAVKKEMIPEDLRRARGACAHAARARSGPFI